MNRRALRLRSALSGASVTTRVLVLTTSAKAKTRVCPAYFQFKCRMAGQTLVLAARHKTAPSAQATHDVYGIEIGGQMLEKKAGQMFKKHRPNN